MENKHSLAPIVVFGFVRANTLSEVFEGLKKNRLAADSDLFVFVDGPRKEENRKDIREVVKLCHSISGFKSVTIKESERNMGLDPSVIAGVTEVINRYGKAVVLEDDVVPGDNFLDFMNQCFGDISCCFKPIFINENIFQFNSSIYYVPNFSNTGNNSFVVSET